MQLCSLIKAFIVSLQRMGQAKILPYPICKQPGRHLGAFQSGPVLFTVLVLLLSYCVCGKLLECDQTVYLMCSLLNMSLLAVV